MLVSDIITEVRRRIFDEQADEYSDLELISYINDAITYMSFQLVDYGNHENIDEFVFTGGNEVIPEEFIAWAGEYPVFLIGRKIRPILSDLQLPITLRYYKAHPRVRQDIDDVDFREPFLSEIIATVTKLALNRNDFSLNQENSDIASLGSVMGGALSGRRKQ